MRTALSGLVAALALVALGSVADAKQFKFVGMHPIPAAAGNGFCYIEAPHVHVYQPHKPKALYRNHDDNYYFVGDPVAHGYDGPRHSYYGHHPIHVDASLGGDPHGDVEYCYLDGPHNHYYTPPVEASFVVKGGVYFYAGDYPQAYEYGRPDYATINAVYKPMKYERPVYVEAPPAEYHGPVVVVSARPAVVVEAPVVVAPAVRAGIEVVVPAPSLHVEVGLPGVVIGGGVVHHHHDTVIVHDHRHKRYKHHNKGNGHWKRRGRGHYKH